jgi:hypothetical protein
MYDCDSFDRKKGERQREKGKLVRAGAKSR